MDHVTRRPRGRIPPPRRFRAGFRRVPRAWLPGVLTIGNLLGGYAAILASAERRFFLAIVLIFVAAVFDALDGRVARLTGATSELGGQLDSLCDAVSFAVAPSILVFHMGLHTLGRAGYAVCFLFAACGVLRLARFNTLPSDHVYFLGLPIPLAAAAVITPPLLTEGEPLPQQFVPYHAVLVAVIALLMVSRIRYRTFKDVRFAARPYRLLAFWAAILAGFVAFAERMVPGLIALYLVSPLAFKLHGSFTRRRRPPPPSPAAPHERPAPLLRRRKDEKGDDALA
jgi:CDP-diacylglycerol---serine O-phosphatidyltransferase